MNRIQFPQSRVNFGVRQIDITPPVGIYHRMWGAAKHDQATGIHRPLKATLLTLSPSEDDSLENTIAMVGLDHCLFWFEEMSQFLTTVAERSQISPERIRVFFSHTHAAGLMGFERIDMPGGDLIVDYLSATAGAVGDAIRVAFNNREEGHIVYGTSHCSLAQNRDYFDAERDEFVCGFNPESTADDTVVIGRITDAQGQMRMSLVNYACHPTTLAWDNTLISPDFVGAMRETIEESTSAPCLFLQGASGDVGPRDGFVGDPEVADRNGRQLGYAVLSGLESIPSPELDFSYAGAVVSGATIGTWEWTKFSSRRSIEIAAFRLQESIAELPYRQDLPQRVELEKQDAEWSARESDARAKGDDQAAQDARAMRERIRRRLTRVAHLDPSCPHPYPVWLCRTGDAVWMALDGEHYNVLQTELRRRFPNQVLIIGTLANGSRSWYLPDKNSYGKGLDQETASVLAKGALEELIAELEVQIKQLIGSRS